jgi:methylenetetrahydrofolate dehydrogenase (NADP+)/methenyltetrahydrofolate cyclohydrolase
MQRLLNGKELAEIIKAEIRTEVEGRLLRGEKIPHLAAILVGNNPASEAYIKNKIKSCEQVGFQSSLIRRANTITQDELLEEVKRLNNDPDVDGFIVQLPLPKHIDESAITLAIDPQKDVDGFHPLNFGLMAQGLPAHLPATPFGILQLLKRNNLATAGKNCVIVGRSNIVGTPLSILLSRKGWDCTVTLAHSRNKNLAEVCREADILVAAIGIPHFIKADMVKNGAIVIDVGINRIEDISHVKGSRLVGDVDYAAVAPKASYITPVPGGVGPMTVTSLIFNTLQACKNK